MKSGPVLFLIGENQGGLSDVCSAYVDYFRRSHKDLRLIVLTENKKRKQSFSGKRILCSDLQKLDKKSVSELRKTILSLRPRLIMTESLLFPYIKDMNIPFIADIHYLMAKNNSVSRPPQVHFKSPPDLDLHFRYYLLQKELMEKQFLVNAHLIIANSRSTKKDILTSYSKISSRKVKVVQVGDIVPGQNFVLPSKRKFYSAYSGRFNSIKGVDLLVALAEKLKMEIHAWGAPRGFLKDNRPELKSSLHFHCHQWTFDQPRLSEHLESARFHLFPSFYEPWGLSLTKSLKSGAICIANVHASGHKEQIRHGINGFLVDFAASDFHEEILKIMALPLARLDKIAVKNLKASVSPEEYVSSVVDFLKGVPV